MNYTEKQNQIIAKATKKQVKLIKKTIKAQEKKVIEQIKHLATVSFTDTTYSKAITEVEIKEVSVDYGCLDDVLLDYELNTQTSCLIVATMIYNGGVEAHINAWITVEDNMNFLNGDFRIASVNFDIDHDGLRPNERTFVSDCLDTLGQISDCQE